MKKYLIALLSIIFLLASIFSAQARAPKGQRSGGRSGCGSGKAMWV
jgi:hypothetical protein